METETQTNLSEIELGEIEVQTLQPKPVKVTGQRIDPVVKKETQKEIGKKAVFICKHPDREDSLEISQVKYLKGNKIETAGTWVSLDSDGKLVKNSALGITLSKYGSKTITEMVGKELQTELNGNYLVIKSY
jgi:hypothetical protein